MDGERGYIKIAEGNELRKVERDVLVPKIMKERAMEKCSDYVKGRERERRLCLIVLICSI